MNVAESAAPNRRQGRRGLALTIMLGAQLMIILDATVVNIALPHIETGLHFSAASLSWVMNGYTLTFGGLLLLGGRAGDILGRRRMFMAGIVIFTLASFAGGLAPNAAVLLTARAVQGVGGALASPAVLALVVSGFPEGRERTRALAIYAGVVTGGGSLGLVLGGVIVQWLDWRWVLFINVPIGIAVLAATPLFVAETPRQPGRFDLAGAITSTLGVAALVYGFIRAASNGWGDRVGIAAFAVAAVLLAAFLLTETPAAQPISPLRAGVAFLPLTILLFAVSRFTPRLMPVFGGKRLMVAGMLPVIAGMAWLSQVSPATAYWTGVFPPMVLLGAGMGVVFVPLTTASLAGVRREDSGAASSMVNVMQQLGGSLGLAVLVAVFGTARNSALAHPVAGLSAAAFAHHVLARGVAEAFTLAAVFDAAALLIIVFLIRG